MRLLGEGSGSSVRPAGDRARGAGPLVTGLGSAAPWLPRAVRIAATGFAFVAFGLAALLLALTVFPVCRATARSRSEADDRVQALIHRGFRAFLRLVEGLGLIRTRWLGADVLRTPGAKLVVANHPTLLDVVQLIAVLPQADCVVSDARLRNPFLHLAARAAGYLTNARGAALVEDCAARLRAGRTVLLFPEGTRSPADGLHPLRRGAAHIALAAGAALQPVSIRCEPRILRKGQPFWDVPERAAQFTLRALAPLDPLTCIAAGIARGDAARRITAQLQARLAEAAA
jgi:1-acyl-sn-glycerol-3-phosphate acyltransferase